MANIDYTKLLEDCVKLAKTELGGAWNKAKPYAEHEFRQFAENAEFLAKLSLAGEINDIELKARLHIQKTALANVLITIEGIGLVAAQNVVNGIIGIVFQAIKTALSIALVL